MFAYTIGHERSYDESLVTDPVVYKIGARLDHDPPYEGGWVWSTVEEAAAFLVSASLTFRAAIYKIELPTTWETDVSREPSPEDGVHRLINDAKILCKVEREK